MIVQMRPSADAEEVAAVMEAIMFLGLRTDRLMGVDVTVLPIYGDTSTVSPEQFEQMAGVERVIPISKPYKRAAQKGTGLRPIHQKVLIGGVEIGGKEIVLIAGPCSVESEPQIMNAAEMAKSAGAQILRGGVVKYRSSPYSGWEGIGAGSLSVLESGLRLIVRAGRKFGLPTVVEVLDPSHVSLYEDAGVDCLQVGEPNSRNQALLNRLRETSLPVIHKRGNSLDLEAYLLWVERIMSSGKENVILCERGVAGPNRYTRNTLDIAGIAALRRLSCLPVLVDPSHGTGHRDLVYSGALAGVIAGAVGVLVEAHPNPLVAKSDGHQGLFPEQLECLALAVRSLQDCMPWIRGLDKPSDLFTGKYTGRVGEDKLRFSPEGHANGKENVSLEVPVVELA